VEELRPCQLYLDMMYGLPSHWAMHWYAGMFYESVPNPLAPFAAEHELTKTLPSIALASKFEFVQLTLESLGMLPSVNRGIYVIDGTVLVPMSGSAAVV
jgi:hypothetical protein